MLGYRSLFRVPDHDDVFDDSLKLFHDWLREKDYDPDALVWNGSAAVDEGAEAALLDHQPRDGSRAVRARLVETKDSGQWVTVLTVIQQRRNPVPWVWVDVEAPSQFRGAVGIPRLVRYLLEVFSEARDGTGLLGPAPRRVGFEGVPELCAVVRDPDRRGLTFLAADDQEPLPYWTSTVDKILRQTVGLASAYVLEWEAAKEFGERMGASHAVAPGTVRTFRPGADDTDALDGRRHRVLSTQRLLDTDFRHLARMLGRRARDAVIDAPLPAPVRRANTLLDRLMDDVVVGSTAQSRNWTAPPKPRPSEPGATALPLRSQSPLPLHREERPQSVTGQAEMPIEVHAAAVALAREFGRNELDLTVLTEIGRLAKAGREAVTHQYRVKQQFEDLRERLERAEQERSDLLSRLENEQFEHAVVQDELLEERNTVRYLRRVLAAQGRHDVAYSLPDTPVEHPPESFEDLFERMSELRYVRFTGDKQQALDLDPLDEFGNWPRKAWSALLALEDYAAAKSAGRCNTGVFGYLTNLPDGCRGFSVNRFAPDESTDVQTNRRFRQARTFPVPPEVDSQGRIFMGAHFKLAQFGIISPRLHYHDNTARDGLVYVGYLGRHLPTKQTN
ncbi:hypothetical protein SaccyDRAFT_4448 [Saccharomonospora cyanea NA-134]|uniref:Uncharacterized protein n=2 Tax=Saccharomonospora cyanea TaxID=40989 RepID=H5XP09_9PSEU|nr:hypothetical protein SaccyDRAFT_4448 [Saccharomonospora cyanea NA-134]